MQTIEFLQTSKWIISLYPPETQRMIFHMGLAEHILARDKKQESILDDVFTAIHNMVTARIALASHPLAREILEAFNLKELLEEEFTIHLSKLSFFMHNRSDRTLDPIDHHETVGFLHKIRNAWETLVDCIPPIEHLTTPPEIINETDYDDILTIELRYAEHVLPPAATIGKVITSVQDLYSAMAILTNDKNNTSLSVLYVASGSSFRFDFKALGKEPIKQLKELLIEVWMMIRHRKAEDIHRNTKVLLENLTVVEKITQLENGNVLQHDEATRLRRVVIDSALDLFEQGALLREIPATETVANQKLIETYQQKLLPAPPSPKASGSPSADSPSPRSTRLRIPKAKAKKRGKKDNS